MSRKHSVQEWLERYYHYVLMHTEVGAEAMEYLSNRGIDKEIMKKFKLGYSPFDVQPTLGFLKGKGFSFNDLVEERILIRYQNGKNKGKLTDPFKNRITFPIQNHLGKTVAFGGRTLDDKNKIKYINSSESNTFSKGDNLYGLSFAKKEIRNEGYAIVFEGYFDSIRAYQSGIKNSVATLGTALTINQALLIKNITKNVALVFDGDKAGMEASFKSASVLEEVGCNVRIAHIDNNLDPDDYIKKHGSEVFRSEVIALAKPLAESFIEFKKRDHDLTTPNGRFSFASNVLNEISTNDASEVKEVLKTLGMTLNVPLKNIYEGLEK